jgi:hypothetical protein
MFIGDSPLGGVAERSNAAVLKIDLANALRCRERHSFQESGTEMHRAEWSGIGVGIRIGIKAW